MQALVDTAPSPPAAQAECRTGRVLLPVRRASTVQDTPRSGASGAPLLERTFAPEAATCWTHPSLFRCSRPDVGTDFGTGPRHGLQCVAVFSQH